MSARRQPWVLELGEGQWRGQPPRGRLRLQVVGISRSNTPGLVVVSGWRHFDDAQPRFCRVLVPAGLVPRPGPVPGRGACR
jgi:hypothetical protein